MRINVSRSLSLTAVVCILAAGPMIYASSTGALAQAAALASPPPPPSLVNGPASGPPRPTAPPSISAQSTTPTDFLDHSIPAGYGIIRGRVIDDNTGATLKNARVSIPELNLVTISDGNGNFAFDSIKVDVDNGLVVTLVARMPGYGEHTMINVSVSSQNTATALLTLKKGSAPTRWFGGLPGHSKNALVSQSAQANLPLSAFSTAPGSRGGPDIPNFTSTASPPLYIRVAIYPLNSDGTRANNAIIRVDTVDFDFYMKHVLGSEWDASWGATAYESLKAGAMAVKEYGWYWAIHAGNCSYDVENSQNDQVYDPYISYTTTDNAIDDQSTTGWWEYSATTGLSTIFKSQYVAGAYDGTTLCPSGPPGFYDPTNCMTQKGSHYWADPPQSKNYQWILSHYYAFGALTYFNYPPRSPNTYVSRAATNSITLTYSSPSATSYAIYRYDNNSTWVLKTITSNTSWTDSSATTISSTSYAYGVDAHGNGGWSPSTFNSGWIVATPKSASNPVSPTTTAFFIATSTIEIRARTSATSIDNYIVDKWSPTSSLWVTVYSGLPSTVSDDGKNHRSASTSLPIAFIDNTESPTGSGDFVYRDTTWMTPSVTSSYTISYHTTAWSDWSNYNGSIEARPYSPY